ncbi:hypothetical protein BaOVIS_014310 [Babesia ovis]|uniref:Uncharacterized protein n=1 Tax=Babesia ovis TaxID=5869 RepID=A0A9W5WV77_BABOV|nr:hypothetical protein BaOVIS_014310 [Babesia ovis]
MLASSTLPLAPAYRLVGGSMYTPICCGKLPRRCFIASRARSSPESIVRGVEKMCLDQTNCAFTAQAVGETFRNASEDMTPLQVLRGLNAFANMGYCNQTLFVCLAERIQKLNENTSPRHIAQLVTLMKRMNITHALVVDPLMSVLMRQLHNYVVELPDIILNSSHLGVTDMHHVELFRTQALLHMNDLKAKIIRCAEALSRFRSGTCSVIDRVLEEYTPNIETLKLKQQLYLLATAGRYNHDACLKIIDNIVSRLQSIQLATEDISTLLTLQRSLGIVVPKILDVIINAMELMLKDPDYANGALAYHIYLLCLLGQTGNRAILSMLQRFAHRNAPPSATSQLIYAISLIHRNNKETAVESTYLDTLVEHMESCHRHLTLNQQKELYEALICLDKVNVLPPGLSKFMSTKIPTTLPTMCREENDQQLGIIGGESYVFVNSKDGSNTALVSITESGVLNILDMASSVAVRPCTLQYVHALEHLLSKGEDSGIGPRIGYRVSRSLADRLEV